jgi:hypothetical protein
MVISPRKDPGDPVRRHLLALVQGRQRPSRDTTSARRCRRSSLYTTSAPAVALTPARQHGLHARRAPFSSTTLRPAGQILRNTSPGLESPEMAVDLYGAGEIYVNFTGESGNDSVRASHPVIFTRDSRRSKINMTRSTYSAST